MKKIICLVLLVSLCCGLLTGCGGDTMSANEIKKLPSMTLEEIASTRLVEQSNASGMVGDNSIYNYMADRVVVDATKLMKVNAKDERNITALLENINIQLSGKGGNVLTDAYANYLLLEFAKTPYEWKQSSKNIVGFDPATRLYFIDVTYATTGEYKTVVPDSAIPLGHPEESIKRGKRYTDYLSMMQENFNGEYDKYNNSLYNFRQTWGHEDDIFAEQQGISLYERTLKNLEKRRAEGLPETGGIGRLTYSGLVRDNNFKSRGATMTVRYILKYALNLGEETDLTVEALYLKDYEVIDSEGLFKGYTLKDKAALEILEPFIDKLILSYNKCVEESNHIGLCSIFTDYGLIDKYYDDINNYTYNSVGTYNFEILERKNNGKEVAVKVNRENQIRAKGADMSLPTYDEVLVFNVLLGANDTVTLQDVYLVKSKLVGEPLSVIRNVTGISEQMQYTDEAFISTNKKKVEELISKFTSLSTSGKVDTEEFFDYVDVSVSEATANKISSQIKAIVPKKNTVYIVSWNTTTNVYCSVTIREILECNDGIFDTEAVVDIAKKSDTWKVVNYTRTVNIKTKEAQINTESTTALATHTKDGSEGVTNVEEVTEKKDIEVNKPTNVEVDKGYELEEEEIPVEPDPIVPEVSDTPSVSTPDNSGSSTPVVEDTSTPELDTPVVSGGTGDFD